MTNIKRLIKFRFKTLDLLTSPVTVEHDHVLDSVKTISRIILFLHT